MAVSLRAIGFEDRDVVAGINLDPQQEDYSGGSIDIIFDRMRTSPPQQHPFALLDGDVVRGFFVLREGNALPPWAERDCMSMHNIRLDRRIQGRGIGRSAVRLAVEWIAQERAAVTQMMSSVNLGNVAATRMALGCGWIPTGAIIEGRLGPELILRAPIMRSDPSQSRAASTSTL